MSNLRFALIAFMTGGDFLRNNKLDNIRAIAILSVVFGHSIILYSEYWNLFLTNRSSEVFNVIKNIINIYQMPVFFALSGWLYYVKIEKNEDWKTFFTVKFKRLIIPYVIIGIMYMIPIQTVDKILHKHLNL